MDRPFPALGLLLAVLLSAATWLALPTQSSADEAPSQVLDRPMPDLLLAPSHDPSSRTQELELMARQADLHTQYAFELASRGAHFSARAEFVMALRLVAQGLDAQYRGKAHSRTLAAGLTALAEAEDFCPRGSNFEADLDLPKIVRGHRTPVLHGTNCADMSVLDAIQSYLTFAQEQLSYAAGGEVAGSMALYGLGKLHETLAEKLTTGAGAARPKAVVFYQASLLVSPRNYMASNDLGVVLGRSGRYEDARAALEHSLSIHAQPSGWHNLAVVYSRLGIDEAARRAAMLAQAGRPAAPAKPKLAPGAIQWVDPSVFAQAGSQMPSSQPAPPVTQPMSPPVEPQQAAGWLPWKLLDTKR